MSDNMKMWPEKMLALDKNDRNGANYIREDIAKEREQKVIRAFCELQESEFGLQKWDKEDIYEKAGLEELK